MRQAVATIAAIGMMLLAWRVIGWIAPVSPWLTFTQVYVYDADFGAPVHMEVTQEVRRDFNGAYHVVVRNVADNSAVCDYHTPFEYKSENSPQDPLTLYWWSNDVRCKILPIGAYYVETTRWVERFGGLIPDGQISVISNVFEIKQKEKP